MKGSRFTRAGGVAVRTGLSGVLSLVVVLSGCGGGAGEGMEKSMLKGVTGQFVERLDQRLLFAVGDVYTGVSPRTVVSEDAGWRFKLGPTGTPQATNFNDSTWSAVSLPHTWNNLDALSGNPASGVGWYRKFVTLDSAMAGQNLFLHFEGGSLSTSVYVDGTQIDFKKSTAAVDPHNGGFQTFDFDVTAALNAPVPAGLAGHLIAVSVSNVTDANVAPSGSGGYPRQGGLYRDVSLIGVSPTHVAVQENVSHTGLAGADSVTPISTNGVYFTNSTVALGASSANLTVKAVVDNAGAARSVNVTSVLVDAGGIVRSTATTTQSLATNQVGAAVTVNSTIATPHLWDGRADPYLYTLYVEVRDGGTGALLDVQSQKVGIRSFKLVASPNTTNTDPSDDAPFMLNGHPYKLVGADMHQDSGRLDANGNPVGWAQSDAQIQADIDLLADMGGTVIRTSHYQDNQAFYDYCDKVGIMVYTENPIFNTNNNTSDAYLTNVEDQYNELIRQNVNHPSVFAWGFANEATDTAQLRTVFTQLKAIQRAVDPGRVTGVADYGGIPSSSANSDGIADIKGTHRYDYWYGYSNQGVLQTHNSFPSQPLGITEFGGGGSAYQYTDNAIVLPVANLPGGVTTHFHPANQLTVIAESQLTDMAQYNFLWGTVVWQMFDSASTGNFEGDQNAINDKGIVTRDRTPKDDYYFYKASWNDPTRSWANAKVLKISDQFWTVRNSSTATVTVFSNIGAPSLAVNGVSLGTMSALVVSGYHTSGGRVNKTVPNAYTFTLTGANALSVGNNVIQTSVTYGGQTYSDSATWTYYNSASFAGSAPFVKVNFQPSGSATPAGYVADSGAAFGVRSSGASYGWLSETGAAGGTFSTSATADAFETGVTVSYNATTKAGSTWEYALPNGVYDVKIGAGQTGTANAVNNFRIEGQTAAIDTDGLGEHDTFYSRVTVKDGRLTLSGAAGAFNAKLDFVEINVVDNTLPVGSATYNYNAGPSVSVQFSEAIDVGMLDASDLILRPESGADRRADSVTYDPSTRTATFKTNTPLANGNYTAILPAGSVADANGIPTAVDIKVSFFVLAGDANRDRRVDITDYQIWRANFNTAGTFSQGNFDYTGLIDQADYAIWKANFNASVPEPVVAAGLTLSEAPRVFPTVRIPPARVLASGVRLPFAVAPIVFSAPVMGPIFKDRSEKDLFV